MTKHFSLLLFNIFICLNILIGQDLIDKTKLGLTTKPSGITNKIAEEIANKRVSSPTELKPFKISNELRTPENKYVQDEVYLSIDKDEIRKIFESKNEYIVLDIPVSNENSFQVELVRTNIFSDNYVGRTSSGQTMSQKDIEAVFYRGIVKNDANSIVAITVFKDYLEGLVADDYGNYIIGKMEQSAKEYILYNDKKLKVSNNFTCGVSDEMRKNIDTQVDNSNNRLGGQSVDVYIESDYQTYIDHGYNITAVGNYMLSLFMQVCTIYANENIDVNFSGSYIWQTPDPYMSGVYASDMFILFTNEKTSTTFYGDLAHLISTRTFVNDEGEIVRAGLGWIDELCGPRPFAVSTGMNTNVVPFATYSWDVQVFAHEMGHNFGSHHTHDCVWNGNYTQIDDCAGYADPDNVTDCYDDTSPIIPANGGTIMSYCNELTEGINFNLGFGPQPGDLIRDRYNTSCLIPLPDLIVTNASVSPNNTYVGGTINLSCTLKNIGTSGTGQAHVIYYLSDDQTYDPSDYRIGQGIINAGLGVGEEVNFTGSYVLPASANGCKYIVFFADRNEITIESNENNNQNNQSICIGTIYPEPDLIVINTSVTPDPAIEGTTRTATCKVKNVGAASAGSTFRLHFYLSNNNTYSANDTYLGYKTIPNLGANAQSGEQSVTYSVPNSMTGCNYIIYKVDKPNWVAESNEANNTSVQEFCSFPLCDPPLTSALWAEEYCNYAYVHCDKPAYTGVRKRLQYKKKTESTWTTEPTTTLWYVGLFGLSNVEYQYRFALECIPNSGIYSNYSVIKTFRPNNAICKIGDFSLETKTFSVYPNPAEDIVNIKLDINEIVETIQVYSLQGLLVKEWNIQELQESSFQLDLNELNTGVYMLRINDTHIEKITKL